MGYYVNVLQFLSIRRPGRSAKNQETRFVSARPVPALSGGAGEKNVASDEAFKHTEGSWAPMTGKCWTRKVDELGRIVLPRELREEIGLQDREPLEIHLEHGQVTLHKKSERCVICGSDQELSPIKEKMICKSCIQELSGEK